MSQGCRAKLAPDQWWHFCGETDMGQTLPVLCTACGGDMIRADDPDWAANLAKAKIVWKAQAEQADLEREQYAWRHPNDWTITPLPPEAQSDLENPTVSFGYAPTFIMIKLPPSKIDRIERSLCRTIDPWALGLTAEQREELTKQLRTSAEAIADWLDNPKNSIEDYFSNHPKR